MASLKSLIEPEVLKKPTGSCMSGYCPVLDSYVIFLNLWSGFLGKWKSNTLWFWVFWKFSKIKENLHWFILVHMESAFVIFLLIKKNYLA
jgi:hypothetical protein